jgi:hypothetical protein
MNLLPPLFYMEAKFGPLEKRIKNGDIGMKFFRRPAGYTHFSEDQPVTPV